MEIIILLVVWTGIGGVIGMVIGDLRDKNNGMLGLALGALLGPVGWIIAAVLPGDEAEAAKPKKISPADMEAKLKIARLEGQLAGLKQTSKPAAKTAARMKYDDDGTIPTYKLD